MKIALVVLLLAFTFTAFGQGVDSPKFDIADFNNKLKVAEWLVEYDLVAWKTSDEVMKQDQSELAKLGREWFCFQDTNGLWHAVYGRLENDKFVLVFHFTMDKKQKIVKSTDKTEEEFLDLHAKALATASKHLSERLKDRGAPRFNQYIKQNADKSFNVWLLPAFQTDGTAVYGGEAVYQIDKTGEKIVRDDSYFQAGFRGFKTGNPREIWLNFSELEKPTLGAIFFVWYYRPYFTKIVIDTSKSTSSVIAGMWVHVEKETK